MSNTQINRVTGFLILAVLGSVVHAQTYSPLYELGTNSGDPNYPQGIFAQGRDGNLYSTSSSGGANGTGAIFQLTPSGGMNVVYSFPSGLNGQPEGGLTLGTDGNLYGTTTIGGTANAGTVFKITTGGTPAVLHEFNGKTEGDLPKIAPIQATDGNFYGTAGDGISNYGAFYRMTPAGAMTPLYQFGGAPANLRYPTVLLQGTDGNFYGISGDAPGSPNGAVYKVTSGGKLTVLHYFAGGPNDGGEPTDLIQGGDGNFYGTTKYGGSNGQGTIFKMTPAGKVTILLSSSASTIGPFPQSLVQATDNNFYGGAYTGPTSFGSLFRINSAGAYKVLFDKFSNGNGTHPDDPLLQHTTGKFYSATYEGGTGTHCACGVLYSFDMGFGPFVTFLAAQSVGKVGKKNIGILGQGLTGTTEVSFNGAAANFMFVSDTFLTATVPSGAKTGPIIVTTSGGTLTSNKTFLVTPQIKSFTPESGPVTTVVTITGVSLIQTTKVTFGGGKTASFNVLNDMTVTATVPSGAVTGKIAITTAGGSANSATNFTVTP